VIVLLVVRIIKSERRNRGAQHIHRKRRAWRLAKKFENTRIELTFQGQVLLQVFQFAAFRQPSKPEQVAGLRKSGMIG